MPHWMENQAVGIQQSNRESEEGPRAAGQAVPPRRRVCGRRRGATAKEAARRKGGPKPNKYTHRKAQKGYTKARAVVPAYYMHLVEFGAAPHAIGAGDSLGRVTKRRTYQRSQTGKPHPGARPRPFLRPAWDDSKGDALEAIKAAVRAEIQAMASKARK